MSTGWKTVDWDGNLQLGFKCWRKKFGRGQVSVGIGGFLDISYSYGANSDGSCGGTRWNYGLPPLTEEEAMEEVDRNKGKSDGSYRHPKRLTRDQAEAWMAALPNLRKEN